LVAAKSASDRFRDCRSEMRLILAGVAIIRLRISWLCSPRIVSPLRQRSRFAISGLCAEGPLLNRASKAEGALGCPFIAQRHASKPLPAPLAGAAERQTRSTAARLFPQALAPSSLSAVAQGEHPLFDKSAALPFWWLCFLAWRDADSRVLRCPCFVRCFDRGCCGGLSFFHSLSSCVSDC
jgi:hypothetical protein